VDEWIGTPIESHNSNYNKEEAKCVCMLVQIITKKFFSAAVTAVCDQEGVKKKETYKKNQ